jgi:alanyl-tRNA synthetase
MTSSEIRQSFLDFFKSKQHTIVPSSSLMPDSPNLLFTNAGMNQFVPIFLGQQPCPYKPGRAADTQKCIRAGGKHNDLEDVGLDTYHHTFFEMLGNWSFGDYFKREAIDWAWELVTEIWKFPKNRLYATVYNPDKSKGDPSDFDQESWNYWAEKFRSAGLDPAIHIVNGNKKDNFWMMGETGPCGPCSELHVDLTPEGDTKGSLVNKGSAQCIEIWNLVFIQFNARVTRTEKKETAPAIFEEKAVEWAFDALPAKHVDTGMGFERVTSIIQGTKGFKDFVNARISNYETDIFTPIFAKLEQLTTAGGHPQKYTSTLPTGVRIVDEKEHPASANDVEAKDIAFRVIADHIRTLSFSIADGILPGNNDRNYVLRRILRRAVKYGRTLGFQKPFFYELVDTLAEKMGHIFPELEKKKESIKNVIRAEEEAFNRTLDKGLAIFETSIHPVERSTVQREDVGKLTTLSPVYLRRDVLTVKEISGALAFQLYDTYGFPLDLTELLARERGLSVDTAGFEKLMEEQRARARASQKKQVISVTAVETAIPTKFIGYDNLQTEATIQEVIVIKEKVPPAGLKRPGDEKPQEEFREKTGIILESSPFYAEMGGQVGDTGEITGSGNLWRVVNTQKAGNAFLHFIDSADAPAVGSRVQLSVDPSRRNAIQRHHTVTHLFHWALHEVASEDALQKGSYVGPEKLTFDFNSAPLTPQQIRDIEKLVNERIVENGSVSWTEIPYSEAKSRNDITHLFGEKYGDRVRVVQIGGDREKLNGYSMELCGGTHTRSTGEIGLFRIVGESAIAAGVRRIEAVAGPLAYAQARHDADLLATLAGKINSPLHELEKKIESLLAHQKELEKQLKSAQQREAAHSAKSLVTRARPGAIPAIIENLGAADGDTLQVIADSLKSQFHGAILLAGALDGNVSLVAAVTPDFTSKIQAGKIIQTIAPIVGGKGGGRPDNARGGGKDSSKLNEALAKAAEFISSAK